MADKVTVLLVDDHALVRKGFRRMLEEKDQQAIMRYANNYLGYKDAYLKELSAISRQQNQTTES